MAAGGGRRWRGGLRRWRRCSGSPRRTCGCWNGSAGSCRTPPTSWARRSPWRWATRSSSSGTGRGPCGAGRLRAGGGAAAGYRPRPGGAAVHRAAQRPAVPGDGDRPGRPAVPGRRLGGCRAAGAAAHQRARCLPGGVGDRERGRRPYPTRRVRLRGGGAGWRWWAARRAGRRWRGRWPGPAGRRCRRRPGGGGRGAAGGRGHAAAGRSRPAGPAPTPRAPPALRHLGNRPRRWPCGGRGGGGRGCRHYGRAWPVSPGDGRLPHRRPCRLGQALPRGAGSPCPAAVVALAVCSGEAARLALAGRRACRGACGGGACRLRARRGGHAWLVGDHGRRRPSAGGGPVGRRDPGPGHRAGPAGLERTPGQGRVGQVRPGGPGRLPALGRVRAGAGLPAGRDGPIPACLLLRAGPGDQGPGRGRHGAPVDPCLAAPADAWAGGGAGPDRGGAGRAAGRLSAAARPAGPSRGAGRASGTRPRHATAGDLTLGGHVGPVLVGLTIRPCTPGRNDLLVYLLPAGGELAAARISTAVAVDGHPVQVEACGPSCRRGAAPLAPGAQVQIALAGQARGAGVVAFRLPLLPAPDGRALLGRMQARMHHLATLGYTEVLSSGFAGAPLRSSYQQQAPDRLRVQTSAGSKTVWEGTTMYLQRQPGEGWIAQPDSAPYTVPSFVWDYLPTRLLDPRIVGAAQVDGVATKILAFFGPSDSAPIWFRLWVDPDGLVRRAEMRAAGHFMDQRYDHFDAPLAIEAPSQTR